MAREIKLNPLYRKFVVDVSEAQALAREFFGEDAAADLAFRIYDLLPSSSDSPTAHEEARRNLLASASMAREIFGPSARPDSILEVYERCFTDDEEEDDDEDLDFGEA